MNDYKDPNDENKILNPSVYKKEKKDDKEVYTEEAVIKYYSEKLGGINHNYSSKKDTPTPRDKSTSDNF
jgi:hypothetical protein